MRNNPLVGTVLTTLTVLSLAMSQPLIPAGAQAPQAAMEQIILAPPPEPEVRPEINHPWELDMNRSGIDDLLEIRLRDIRAALLVERNPTKRQSLAMRLDEPVRVELVFSRQITQPQLNAFLALGG